MRANIVMAIMTIVVLLLSIASFVGLIYITPLGFGKETYKEYSPVKQRYIKTFLILTWVSIVLNTFYIIYNMTV
jgi:hypothetical protein